MRLLKMLTFWSEADTKFNYKQIELQVKELFQNLNHPDTHITHY
jgi:hypothetical protein